jgi:hypothetical protein
MSRNLGMTNKMVIFKKVIGVFLALLLLGACMFVYLNSQDISDYFKSLSFAPSSNVKLIEEQIAFTKKGRRIFYASEPKLAETSEFNAVCVRREIEVNVLGCYTGREIFVFNIQNEELDGINTVTMVHEFLHAVYERLSDKEKNEMNGYLQSFYDEVADEVLDDRMGYYERTEPDEFYNELHSIFGTEYRDLSVELNKHYTRYFGNRLKIVELREGYNSKFLELTDRAEELIRRMESLATEIDASTSEYRDRVDELNVMISDFNRRANNGSFVSQAEFDAERSVLAKEQNTLKNFLGSLQKKIAEYNDMVVELNSISIRIDSLNNSIDSNFDPVPVI